MYASDDANLVAVEASIRSVIRHASEPVVFHFIGDTPLNSTFPNLHYYNLTQVATKYRLQDFTNIRKRKESSLVGLNSNLANFVRFVIADLLPNQHKAFWVDADTIIECNVVSMVRNALTTSPHAIAAVPIQRKPMGIKRQYTNKLSISFNAGVFVVDLRRWRLKGFTKQIRKLTLKNRKENIYEYGSQPPLVLTIGDKFEHLSQSWNVKVNKMNRGDHKGKACLLHWSGKRKPWDTFNDPNMHNELWQRYATSNVDMTQEFRPDNIILPERGVSCSSYRCYYQLKSNPQVGYLVARSPSSAPGILPKMATEANWFEAMVKSWHYAERLRRKYQITHFLLAPPTNMTISKDLASMLNQGMNHHGMNQDNEGNMERRERYKEGSTVFLQKVATAPKSNLLIGIQTLKYEAFQNHFDEFLARIKDKKSFARHVSQSLADTRRLIRKEPCLALDFELLLDQKGNVYHLDFERCFQLKANNDDDDDDSESCFKVLDQVEQLVHRAADQQS